MSEDAQAMMASLLGAASRKSPGNALVRQPSVSEMEFFKTNPNVAGYASEDDRVVLNPNSKLNDVERAAVVKNEASRIWMRKNDIDPPFTITSEQRNAFAGSPYQKDDKALRQTLVARILSGDPSAGKITAEQKKFAESISKNIDAWLAGGSR